MNENLLNVMGSFSETALDCIEKQNEEIEDLKRENARLKDKIDKAVEHIKNIDKDEETLNDDTRIYMVQDVDVYEIEKILKEK